MDENKTPWPATALPDPSQQRRVMAHISDDVLMGFAKDPTVPTGIDLPLKQGDFPYMMPDSPPERLPIGGEGHVGVEAGSQAAKEVVIDAVAGKRSDSRMIVTALLRGEMSVVVVRVEDSGEYFEFSVGQARGLADQIRKVANYTERVIMKEERARKAAGLTASGRRIPGGAAGVGPAKATKRYRHH